MEISDALKSQITLQLINGESHMTIYVNYWRRKVLCTFCIFNINNKSIVFNNKLRYMVVARFQIRKLNLIEIFILVAAI